MGLLSTILTLPYAPVRGLISLAEVLRQQAERELAGSASVRRRLEALEEAAAAGEITQSERAQGEQAVLERVLAPPARAAEPDDGRR